MSVKIFFFETLSVIIRAANRLIINFPALFIYVFFPSLLYILSSIDPAAYPSEFGSDYPTHGKLRLNYPVINHANANYM